MSTATKLPKKIEPDPCDELDELELELLLEGLRRRFGYDFREYARASLKRRACKAMAAERVETPLRYLEKILREPGAVDRLLNTMSVSVTAMFRDPTFYRALRQKVVPALRTYPFVRVWSVGCSTGAEPYSLAILLEEEGLAGRYQIYATDMNEAVLEQARKGSVQIDELKQYTQNYRQSGGKADFSDYYAARHGHAIVRRRLKQSIVFARHDVVTEPSFNEFHLILCRNVLIYFNEKLHAKVHELLFQSLVRFGVLGLGRKESLRFCPTASEYQVLDRTERLYRRSR